MSAAIRDMIRRKALEAGIDPVHALTMASIETGGTFNPNADNGKHKGLFQFGPDEWKKYGGGKDILNPEANMDAYIGYQGDINKQLTGQLGRAPTPQEQYLGWQQGANGAANILANQDKPAGSLVTPAAVTANGGTSDMTGGQFANMWGSKYNDHQKQIMGQQQPWQGEGDTPPPVDQSAAVDAARTAGDADMGGYGGSPAALPAVPDPGAGNGLLAGLGRAGKILAPNGGAGAIGAMMAQPQDQAPPMPQAQVHRPDMAMQGLLNPWHQQEEQRKKMMGLLR